MRPFDGLLKFFDLTGSAFDTANRSPLYDTIAALTAHAGAQAMTDVLSVMVDCLDPRWRIDDEGTDDGGYSLDLEERVIRLPFFGFSLARAAAHPYYGPHILGNLTMALRMARHADLFGESVVEYHPEGVLRIGRFCAADCAAMLAVAANTARDAGYDSLWKAMLCGPHAAIAMAYERAMPDGGDQALGADSCKRARAAAFNAWFASGDPVREADHQTLNMIDDLFDSGIRLGNKMPSAALLTCLTVDDADGRSYLDAAHTADVLRNPYYLSCTDTINQAHLMQIIADMTVTSVSGIPFRDAGLAARFLPDEFPA